MREIKFRTWDGEKMSNPFTLAEIFNDVPEGYYGNAYVKQDGYNFPLVNELMQYTGLKDKNGKEIYEGDIVRRNPPELQRLSLHDIKNWIVYFGSWCYMRKPIDNENGFAFDAIDARSNCEVIGNIYENPDLLNSEQKLERSVASKA